MKNLNDRVIDLITENDLLAGIILIVSYLNIKGFFKKGKK